jgi:hypothetical protein
MEREIHYQAEEPILVCNLAASRRREWAHEGVTDGSSGSQIEHVAFHQDSGFFSRFFYRLSVRGKSNRDKTGKNERTKHNDHLQAYCPPWRVRRLTVG